MSAQLLRTGDLAVGGCEDIMITGGVGSCVVACLWDAQILTGGMAHMLLPLVDSNFPKIGIAPGSALPHMLALMKRRGSALRNIVCKLTGAGNMFTTMSGGAPEDIGGLIYTETGKVLGDLGIPVVKSAVGGNLGRHVSFDLKSGVVKIRYTNGVLEEI